MASKTNKQGVLELELEQIKSVCYWSRVTIQTTATLSIQLLREFFLNENHVNKLHQRPINCQLAQSRF